MVLSIQTLCSVFSRSTPFDLIQPWVFLGKMQQVFHTWIWGSSAIPPCRSSPVLSGWMVNVGGQPFLGLSRDAQLGFKSGLWLGHSRTVHELLWSHSFVILAVCLGSLSCWKVNLRLQSWGPEHSGEGFRPGYPCTWPHSSFPRLQPVVLSLQLEKHPHSMMLPPPCFTVGTVLDRWLSSAWFSPHIPLRIKAKKSILVSSDQRILFVTILESLHAGFHVSCTEERLPSGHSAIKPRLVEGCSDGDFLQLSPISRCISGAQPQWSLGSSLPLSPRLFSPDSSVLAGRPALGRVLVIPTSSI